MPNWDGAGALEVYVRNDGDVWALGVRLRTEAPGLATFSDAWLNLPPGGSATVRVLPRGDATPAICAEGLNAPTARWRP
jgi:hypothetical protein